LPFLIFLSKGNSGCYLFLLSLKKVTKPEVNPEYAFGDQILDITTVVPNALNAMH